MIFLAFMKVRFCVNLSNHLHGDDNLDDDEVIVIKCFFWRFLRWMGFEMINTKIQISINDRPSGWATFCHGDDVIMYLSNSVFFQFDLIKLNLIQQNYQMSTWSSASGSVISSTHLHWSSMDSFLSRHFPKPLLEKL